MEITVMGFLLRDNPCKNCADRYAGCHAKCEDYKEWQKGYLEFKREEAKERRANAAIKEVRSSGKSRKNISNSYRNKSKLYRLVQEAQNNNLKREDRQINDREDPPKTDL